MEAYTFRWVIGISCVYHAVVFATDVVEARKTLAKRLKREYIKEFVADEAEQIETCQHWQQHANNATKSRVMDFSKVEKPELVDKWIKDWEKRRGRKMSPVNERMIRFAGRNNEL
jgi:hypothetical protein